MLPRLLELHLATTSSEDLQMKVCTQFNPSLLCYHTLPVQESSEEHSDPLHAPAGSGATASLCPSQHPQACGGAIFQGPASRPEGQETVCDLRRTQEGKELCVCVYVDECECLLPTQGSGYKLPDWLSSG